MGRGLQGFAEGKITVGPSVECPLASWDELRLEAGLPSAELLTVDISPTGCLWLRNDTSRALTSVLAYNDTTSLEGHWRVRLEPGTEIAARYGPKNINNSVGSLILRLSLLALGLKLGSGSLPLALGLGLSLAISWVVPRTLKALEIPGMSQWALRFDAVNGICSFAIMLYVPLKLVFGDWGWFIVFGLWRAYQKGDRRCPSFEVSNEALIFCTDGQCVERWVLGKDHAFTSRTTGTPKSSPQVISPCHLARLTPLANAPTGPAQGATVPQTECRCWADRWGITLWQFRELLQDSGFLDQHGNQIEMDINVREFTDRFVKPRTAGTGLGYALLQNSHSPLEVRVMTSHCWEENVLEFFWALETLVGEEEPMFICFLSIYQNEDSSGPSIPAQLGSDALEGPFVVVLKNIRMKNQGRMVVIPNEAVNLYTRLWCVLELYCAWNLGVPIKVRTTGGILDPSTSSREARCGRPGLPVNDDERSIRKGIERGAGYYFVDEAIRSLHHTFVLSQARAA